MWLSQCRGYEKAAIIGHTRRERGQRGVAEGSGQGDGVIGWFRQLNRRGTYPTVAAKKHRVCPFLAIPGLKSASNWYRQHCLDDDRHHRTAWARVHQHKCCCCCCFLVQTFIRARLCTAVEQSSSRKKLIPGGDDERN